MTTATITFVHPKPVTPAPVPHMQLMLTIPEARDLRQQLGELLYNRTLPLVYTIFDKLDDALDNYDADVKLGDVLSGKGPSTRPGVQNICGGAGATTHTSMQGAQGSFGGAGGTAYYVSDVGQSSIQVSP